MKTPPEAKNTIEQAAIKIKKKVKLTTASTKN